MELTPAVMVIKEIDAFVIHVLGELGFEADDIAFYAKLEDAPRCLELLTPVKIEFNIKGYHSEDESLKNSAKCSSDTGIFYLKSDNNTGKTYTQIALSLLFGFPWEQQARSTFGGDPDYNDRGLRIIECIDNHKVSGEVSLTRGGKGCKIILSHDIVEVHHGKQKDTYQLPSDWENFRTRMQGILEAEFLPRDKNLLRICYNKIQDIIRSQLNSTLESVQDYRRSIQATPEQIALAQKISNIKTEIQDLNRERAAIHKVQGDWEEMAVVVETYGKAVDICREFLTVSEISDSFGPFHQELKDLNEERDTHEQELMRLNAAKDTISFELESLATELGDVSRRLSSELLKEGVAEIRNASTIQDVNDWIRDIHYWPRELISVLERTITKDEPELPYTPPAIPKPHESFKQAAGDIKRMSLQAAEFNAHLYGVLRKFINNVSKVPQDFWSQSADDIAILIESTEEILTRTSDDMSSKQKQRDEWVRRLREFEYFRELQEDKIDPDQLERRKRELTDQLEEGEPRISTPKLLEKVNKFKELIGGSEDISIEIEDFQDFIKKPGEKKDRICEQLEARVRSLDDMKEKMSSKLESLTKKYEAINGVKRDGEDLRVSKLRDSLLVAKSSIESYMDTLAKYLEDSSSTETDLQSKTKDLQRVTSDPRGTYVDLHAPLLNTLNQVFKLICPVTFGVNEDNKWMAFKIDSVNILDGTLSFTGDKGKQRTDRFADMGTGVRSSMTLLGLAGIPCKAPLGRVILVDEKPESALGLDALNQVALKELAKSSELCCVMVSLAERDLPKVELLEAP